MNAVAVSRARCLAGPLPKALAWAMLWIVAAPSLFGRFAPGQTLSDAAVDASTAARTSLPRTAAEQDRVLAQAYALQAQLLTRRGEREAALRAYQRSWRYDPTPPSLLPEIVSLALTLGRKSEARNYAFQLALCSGAEPLAVRTIARELLAAGDDLRAQVLFEHARACEEARREPPRNRSDRLAADHELGQLYHAAGRLPEAAELFASIYAAFTSTTQPLTAADRARIVKDESAARRLWAEAFFAVGKWDEAHACWQSAENLPPAVRAAGLAEVALARGQTPHCRRWLDMCFAAPGGPGREALALLPRIHAAEQPPALAAPALCAELERLHARFPTHDGVARELGLARLAAGRTREGRELLAVVATRAPDAAALSALAGDLLNSREAPQFLDLAGQVVARSGSLALLGEAAEQAPANAEFLSALLAAAKRRARGPATAESSHALYAAALLAWHGGEPATADDCFEQFVALAEAAQVPAPSLVQRRLDWALLQIDQRPAVAVQVLDSVPRAGLPPKREAALEFYRAGGLALAGQLDSALVAARKALTLRPGEPQYELRLAWILHFSGQTDAAEREYAGVIERYGRQFQNAAAVDATREAALALSALASARGDHAAAEEWLERLLDADPQDVAPLNDLAYLWAERGVHLERALRMSHAVIGAVPADPGYRDTHAWVLFKLGKHDLAERELAALCAAAEVDAVSVDHWGDVLAVLGRHAEAAAAWRRAAAAFQAEGNPTKSAQILRKIAAASRP